MPVNRALQEHTKYLCQIYVINAALLLTFAENLI